MEVAYRPATDGQRISGIYLCSLLLASGCYAMLDDGLGFSLVPWKPVIESRLGQSMTATIRGNRVAWEFSRQGGPAIG
ncbi:DUF3363 domain-containing protein [Dickeya dadantii]|uniref:DUF3363 domain-containing protein n=1 Tax=Dickeya dadantii TaxID=204038 RepID=UPI00403C6672